jgi:hypothetical protein
VTLLAVAGTLSAFGFGVLLPNVGTLVNASDALCGGDTEFVTTIDGAGVPAWAYPDTADPSVVARRGFPDGKLPAETSVTQRPALRSNAKFYSERVFDVVAQQFGKDVQQFGSASGDGCTDEVCYDWVDGIHQMKPDAPGCCLAKRVQVPTVDAGPFSILSKAAETTEDAVRLWNPSCTDAISFVGGYTNQLRGGLGDTVNSELWTLNASLCGGACPNEKPMCAEGVAQLTGCADNSTCADGVAALATKAAASRAAGDRGCIEPFCVDVRPFCNLNSASGVRARQLCPSMCGCDDPHAPLALSLPASGCGERCARSGRYLERRAELQCTDIAVNDPRWTTLMDDMDRVRQTWPGDWELSSGVFFADLRTHGCAALRNMTTPPTSYPMYIFSVNLCVEHGSYYPIKPLSYYCPQACNCHAGDDHCPDACPQRTPSSPICLPFQAAMNVGQPPNTGGAANNGHCPISPKFGA